MVSLHLHRYVCVDMRHTVMKRIRYVSMRPIAGKQCKEDELLPRSGPSLAGIMFLVAQLAYVIVGIACVLIPPEPATAVADSEIPADATCLRVTRKTNFVTVDVSIGSPGQIASLLLRMDRVLNASDTERTMRLFSSKVVESSTVHCDDTRETCSDIMLINKGLTDVNEKYVVDFNYRHGSVEAAYNGEAYHLSLDGEFALRAGTTYWLTNSRICYAVAPVVSILAETVMASVENQRLVATKSALLSSEIARSTPVETRQTRTCAASTRLISFR